MGIYLVICILTNLKFVSALRPHRDYLLKRRRYEAMGALVRLGLFLFPGKIVIYTLVSTARALLPSPK